MPVLIRGSSAASQQADQNHTHKTGAEQLTAGLPRGGELRDIAAPVLPERSLIRVEHASAQAHVLIGMPGMARIDPDYFPLLVGNHVLGGGGFVSR
ncbi:MAG: insulinase family protein, partial [Pseudarthrobacter sp.]